MQGIGDVKYKLAILMAVISSPMVYLIYGHPILAIDYGPLQGLVFIFGELLPKPPFRVLNPLIFNNRQAFIVLSVVWLTLGMFLLVTASPRLSLRVRIIGAVLALLIQIVTPFHLFSGYTIIIPIPIPSVFAILLHLSTREKVVRKE